MRKPALLIAWILAFPQLAKAQLPPNPAGGPPTFVCVKVYGGDAPQIDTQIAIQKQIPVTYSVKVPIKNPDPDEDAKKYRIEKRTVLKTVTNYVTRREKAESFEFFDVSGKLLDEAVLLESIPKKGKDAILFQGEKVPAVLKGVAQGRRDPDATKAHTQCPRHRPGPRRFDNLDRRR